MSLIIRLAPTGKRGERKYRIIVKEKRSKRDGRAVENLGWYNKGVGEEKKEIDQKRVAFWIGKGAQPTPTVRKLLNL